MMLQVSKIKDRKVQIIFGFFLILLILWIMFAFYNGKKARKNHVLTHAVVTAVGKGGKGNWGPSITYEYYINNRLINSTNRYHELKYYIHNFIGKSFPVAYRWNGFWHDDQILITPDNFNKYGYSFPDSLNWVLEYVIER